MIVAYITRGSVPTALSVSTDGAGDSLVQLSAPSQPALNSHPCSFRRHFVPRCAHRVVTARHTHKKHVLST